jgi:hypothetical protein
MRLCLANLVSCFIIDAVPNGEMSKKARKGENAEVCQELVNPTELTGKSQKKSAVLTIQQIFEPVPSNAAPQL